MFPRLSPSTLAVPLLAAFAFAAFAPAGQAQLTGKYRVTITNLTRGQILAPAVVATHKTSAEPLFVPGMPASAELAQLAEDAVNQPLVDKLTADPDVMDVETILGAGGPIMPGESASVDINFLFGYNFVSVASMLVTTNDGFVAIRGVRGPNLGTAAHRALVYDAGSEANTESCMHIPGPPCGNAEMRVVDGAEGYVHVHAGVHGIADLVPANHDWRNPGAMIEITRILD